MFKGEVKTVCLCGQPIVVGYEGSEPCIIHKFPPCDLFTETDIIDYLTIIRTTREAGVN